MGEIALVDLPQLLRALCHAFGSLCIGVAHCLERFTKRWYAVPVVGREVGSAVEWTAIRQQEHRHRPPAVTGHCLNGLHVDAVDVGSFFSIDFDVHEFLVHEARGFVVLERFVRHHVTPVAGGVADAQQDRLVLALRPFERLGSPRIPVDRVIGVLKKVGARFSGETVWHVV